LYTNVEEWQNISKNAPWLNPIFLSVDLQESILTAKQSGAKYILMSRGILSTYYYNLNPYLQNLHDFNQSWETITRHLAGFAQPTAIIFLELPAEVANDRVLKRGRGQIRKMDTIDQMKKDRFLFDKYIKRLSNIPVHYVDASGTEQEVLNRIDSVLGLYLKEVTQ
jgi:dTMP kinase